MLWSVTTSRSLLAEATAALDGGDWASARSLLTAALALEDHPDIRYQLARAEEWGADYEAAVRHYEQAFAGYRRRGEVRRPALIAGRELAFLHAAVYGNGAVAEGWLARAHRLADEAGDCVEHGWIALADALSTGDVDAMADHVRRATTVAHRFDDDDLRFCALGYEGLILVLRGQITEGIRLVDEAATAATCGEVRDYLTAGEIYCKMLLCCELTLDVHRAQQWIAVATDFDRRENVPWVSAICRTYYGGILTAAGRWDEAEVELSTALQRYDRSYRALRSSAMVRLADLRVRQGRLAEARRLLSGFEFDSYAVRPLARLHLACGEPELAVVLLRRFLGSAGTGPLQAPELALLVEAEIAAGNIDGARVSCDQLTQVADVNYTQALAHHAAGLVCVASGDERALEQFERALPLFTLAGLRLEAARTRMAIARLLASTNPVVATAEARSALSTFDELSAALDAHEAARFLRARGDHHRAAPRTPGSLSKREDEVLRELCEGRTNEQIAERLFISKRTVEHHVSSILEKLGASSRAEAVAHALRHPAE